MAEETDSDEVPPEANGVASMIRHVLEPAITGGFERMAEDEAYAAAHPSPPVVDSETGLFEITIDPTDFTAFEWQYVVRHWLRRVEHLTYSVVYDENRLAGLRRLVKSGALSSHSPVAEAYYAFGDPSSEIWWSLSGWLSPRIHILPRSAHASMDVDHLGMYWGDLRMVAIDDGMPAPVWAVDEELAFYRAFGIAESNIRPVTSVHRYETWVVAASPRDDSPAGRHDRQRRLTPEEFAICRSALSRRPVKVELPPFAYSAAEGVAERARLREIATQLAYPPSLPRPA